MKKVKYKIMAALILSGLLVACFVGGYNVYSTLTDQQTAITEYRGVLSEQFDRGLKLQVETAVSLIDRIHAEQQSGRLTEEQAKKQAADLVRDLRFDNGNYFWIDTVEGVNVALLGRQEVEGKSRRAAVDPKGNHYIEDMLKQGLQDGGGFSNYWFPKPNETDPKPKRAYTLAYKPYGWVVGAGNWNDHIDTMVKTQENLYAVQLRQDMAMMGGITALSLAILVVFAVWISKKMSGPIEAAAFGVREVADGNLTVQSLSVDSEDEIGELSRDFNEMLQSLQVIVKEVTKTSEMVAASSEELTASSQQSAEASQQVAGSINNVAEGSNRQAELVTSAVNLTETMQKALAESGRAMEHVSGLSAKTQQEANAGGQAIARVVNQMEEISQTVHASAKTVKELEAKSGEIEKIVQTIVGIAGQTNLLALNAAIEAARAGEQGRGFAVVADEVRKLAEQSAASAEEIATLLGGIRVETERAVAGMDAGSTSVERGKETVEEAGVRFQQILSLVDSLSGSVRQLVDAGTAVERDAGQVSTRVHEVLKVSDDIAEEAENVSAATEEQSASMEEIAAASRALANMAENLQHLLARFKL